MKIVLCTEQVYACSVSVSSKSVQRKKQKCYNAAWEARGSLPLLTLVAVNPGQSAPNGERKEDHDPTEYGKGSLIES
jgi:hypothetical protein